MKLNRILISGGGTGGHIFPALSIAAALKRRNPDAKILFVGALGRMEMERVPAAGFEIVGLPVAGFDRKRPWRNIPVLLKLWKSMRKARRIVRDFNPQIAIGVGGYASGPTLKAAQRAGVPTLIQEQNSYAGVTNKLLGKNVAEHHQRKNALALVDRDAAQMILDADAARELPGAISALVADAPARERLSANILKMALPDSDEKIADAAERIVRSHTL